VNNQGGYDWTGIAQAGAGAASGASLGASMFGPMGALGGALVGGLLPGAIQHERDPNSLRSADNPIGAWIRHKLGLKDDPFMDRPPGTPGNAAATPGPTVAALGIGGGGNSQLGERMMQWFGQVIGG
jgi:hypothetical protein